MLMSEGFPSQPTVGKFIKISFLFSPSGIVATPVMATSHIPNLNLGLLVWYFDPPRPDTILDKPIHIQMDLV